MTYERGLTLDCGGAVRVGGEVGAGARKKKGFRVDDARRVGHSCDAMTTGPRRGSFEDFEAAGAIAAARGGSARDRAAIAPPPPRETHARDRSARGGGVAHPAAHVPAAAQPRDALRVLVQRRDVADLELSRYRGPAWSA